MGVAEFVLGLCFEEMTMEKVLILGSGGQIGTELTHALRTHYGTSQVIASDIREPEKSEGPFVLLNVMDGQAVAEVIKKEKVTQVYLLAAMLSATAEKHPQKGWALNMEPLLHLLEMGKEGMYKQMYWPSSIAAFGPTTPKQNTPQHTITEPTTVYGLSKLAGERWCEWYFLKYGVDVRGLRYPGLISYTTPPGGGTTDYAVDIFHHALSSGTYTSFLGPESRLPMMYMPDAIRATLDIMHAPADQIKIRGSYNVGAFSFTPAELASAIQQHIPDFTISYAPDFRQAIADSWPQSIDDAAARADWGWRPQYGLSDMVEAMLAGVKSLSK
jgi:nucleoside-diphosphate-sugar epimerase